MLSRVTMWDWIETTNEKEVQRLVSSKSLLSYFDHHRLRLEFLAWFVLVFTLQVRHVFKSWSLSSISGYETFPSHQTFSFISRKFETRHASWQSKCVASAVPSLCMSINHRSFFLPHLCSIASRETELRCDSITRLLWHFNYRVDKFCARQAKFNHNIALELHSNRHCFEQFFSC